MKRLVGWTVYVASLALALVAPSVGIGFLALLFLASAVAVLYADAGSRRP